MTRLKLCIAAFVCSVLAFAPLAMATETKVPEGAPFLVTNGDPENPTFANAGENLRSGVGSIFIAFNGGGFICSMSVIDDRHILTAAHCLRNALPDGSPDQLVDLAVVFPSLDSGGAYVLWAFDGFEFAVHPDFDFWSQFLGAFAPGDLAIIRLPFDLPGDVERYAMYEGDGEIGKVTRHYGHGRSGTGDSGATGGASFFYARTGLNTYDATLAPLFGLPFLDQLLHDYDNHRMDNNAMGWWFGGFLCNSPNAARGKCATQIDPKISSHKDYDGLEVGVAPGDSGGPGFVDGKIAGVHSFGFTNFCSSVYANTADFTCGLDSSWGEMFGDTRVSNYVGWVEAVMASAPGSLTPIPEPPPAIAPGGTASSTEFEFELSEHTRYFTEAVSVRSLRREVTLEEFKAEFGIE